MSTTVTPKLLLASRSPRRAELLTVIGVAYQPVDIEVDERAFAGELPADYVERVARAKAAQAVSLRGADCAVLAADTTVSLDGRIFGKPSGPDDAHAMLRALSGRQHTVHTAVVLADSTRIECVCVMTLVEFAPLTEALIDAYCTSGEPYDKAGGYGIQGPGWRARAPYRG